METISSHSISRIIDAEHVIILKNGKGMEECAHKELYENKSSYYEIFKAMCTGLNSDKIAKTLS